MQQQVLKRNMSSDMGWAIGEGGGWGQHTSASQDSTSSNWQAMSKTDAASDAGDDASSIKSGSTITNSGNINQQSQDSSSIATSIVSSSSPWSANPTIPGMDAGPWANSSSPAPTTLNSLGWNSNPTSLSLNNQGHNSNMQPGASVIGSNSFNSPSSASGGWPSGMSGNTMASTMPPNVTSLPSGNISSQWPASTMLGKMGDFPKTSEGTWNTPTSMLENKDLSSDPRQWGLDKLADQNWESAKSQWGNTPAAGSVDQGASNGADLSFAQATLKGLKLPPGGSLPPALASRQEEILRAIENHEGWGSRPIRQDTSWEHDDNHKSNKRFQAENQSGASNVWNNSDGTAIWEAVRENQGGNNWGGASGSTSGQSNWNAEKDPNNWGMPPKPQQDPNNWGVGGVTGGNSDPKFGGSWEGAGGAGDASSKMWGQQQKNAIGSWGDAPNVQRSTSISSWGEDGETNNWDSQRQITGGMNRMQNMVPPSPGMNPPSGVPGMMPQGVPGMNMPGMGADPTPWNTTNPATMNPPKMDEPWNKPPPKITSGWGDPAQDGKVDDGTAIWGGSSMQKQQTKPTGWGDAPPQGQWNSTVGAKPARAPNGGWDEASWAMAQRTKQLPPKYTSQHSNPPTQMRSKLLQHLMDMGYRKEEAQNALITNNMNLDQAILDLKTNGGMQRKDLEMDMFQANGQQNRMPYMPKQGMGTDDMNDAHSDQVPNLSTNMQNTPFQNAQVPNQPFIQGNPSLPPSSLNPNGSINPGMQPMMKQKMQQVPPTNVVGPRGQMPPTGNAPNTPALQQQQQQQQILAQLRQAVSNGYISPQLLNYQLPHTILVQLQQLLQLQQARQSVINKMQELRRNRQNPQTQQKLEQMPSIISNIQQQISSLQTRLQQAQNEIFRTQDSSKMKLPNMSQPPSGMVTPVPSQNAAAENIDAISEGLAGVSMNQPPHTNQPPQSMSRLDQWTKPGSGGNADGSQEDDKNKGASSSPNLNLIPGGLGMTGDRTWSSMSTTSTSNWPMSSSDTGTNSLADGKGTSTSASMSSGADIIPEFVPGKPWQGLSTKSVEDDPHLTPGSMINRSMSVNRVQDDNSLTNNLSNNWSNGGKNENSLGLSQLGNHPPPGMPPASMAGAHQWQNNNPYNRQASWGGRSNTSAFTQVGSQNWNDPSQVPSSWILLKHPNSSLDSATIRALCAQHGNLTKFIPQGQAALVQFSSRDQAFQAVQRLNNFNIGNTVIGAEMIGENEAQRAVSQIPPPQPSSAMPPMNASQWSHAPPSFQSGGMNRGGDPWGNPQMQNTHQQQQQQQQQKFPGGDPWGNSSGGGLWGDMNSMGDHNSNQLLNNILGEGTM